MRFVKFILIVLPLLGSNIVKSQKLPAFSGVNKLVFNSDAEEAKPVFNEKGDKMYFVRAYHKENVAYDKVKSNEDIWEAEKDKDGNWTIITNEKSINDEKNNSIIGRGKDQHFFLLNTYQKNENLKYGLALSTKEAEHKWSKPEIIEIPKFKYAGNFYDFFITHDEKVLIISIKGEDTRGEEDLYLSTNTDGKWSEPKSLGDQINTQGFEMSPFLTNDKKYLYFSTNGRDDGLGDADVYVSERLDDSWTNWSEPKNLGDKVNSNAMDCYFILNDVGDYYFSSNRVKEAGLDIYQAIVQPPMITVKGFVYNAKDSSKIESNISLFDSESKNYLDEEKVSNSFEAELTNTIDYTLSVSKNGFANLKMTLNTTSVESGSELIQNVYLNPIIVAPITVEKIEETEIGEKLVLHNILFDLDKYDLLSESFEELDVLSKIMIDKPLMKVEISGHTSNEGKNDYNLKLSDNRAKAVVAYLVSKGVNTKQLIAKGYGETQPIESNDTKSGKENNRRVELKILTK